MYAEHLICFTVESLVGCTVKFLNFGTPEISAVIYLKFKHRGQTLKGILSKWCKWNSKQ